MCDTVLNRYLQMTPLLKPLSIYSSQNLCSIMKLSDFQLSSSEPLRASICSIRNSISSLIDAPWVTLFQ